MYDNDTVSEYIITALYPNMHDNGTIDVIIFSRLYEILFAKIKAKTNLSIYIIKCKNLESFNRSFVYHVQIFIQMAIKYKAMVTKVNK